MKHSTLLIKTTAWLLSLVLVAVVGLVACSEDNENSDPQESIAANVAFEKLSDEVNIISQEYVLNSHGENSGRGFFSFIGKLISTIAIDAVGTINALKLHEGFRDSIIYGACCSHRKTFSWRIYFSTGSDTPLEFSIADNRNLLGQLDSLLEYNIDVIRAKDSNTTSYLGNWHNAIVIEALKTGDFFQLLNLKELNGL